MVYLQLKIELGGIKPKIWRRVIVRDSISFHKLHEIIQVILGWENYHLYEFVMNDGAKIGLIYEDMDYEIKDAKKLRLSSYLLDVKLAFKYMYDFGDGWECGLMFEKVLHDLPENVGGAPFCLGGERAGPLEDCGGLGGYGRFSNILKNGKDPYGGNVKELMSWMGNWRPENFDIVKINKELE